MGRRQPECGQSAEAVEHRTGSQHPARICHPEHRYIEELSVMNFFAVVETCRPSRSPGE